MGVVAGLSPATTEFYIGSVCGIYVGQNGNGIGFCPRISISPCQCHFTTGRYCCFVCTHMAPELYNLSHWQRRKIKHFSLCLCWPVHPCHDDLARLWAVDGVGPSMLNSQLQRQNQSLFSVLQTVRTGCGAHPASFSIYMGKGCCLSGSKAAAAWRYTHISS